MFKHAFVTLSIAVALTAACKSSDVNTNAGPNPRDAATAGSTAATRAAQSTSPQAAALSVEDRQFAENAAEGGKKEVELGHLAQQHGASDAVKHLGQRIADDHERANRELDSLLGGADVSRTSSPSDNDSDRRRLEKMSGAAFDRAYVDLMISDHRKDITEFERASRSSNEAVRTFAEKTLPTLREHLTQAREAKEGLKK